MKSPHSDWGFLCAALPALPPPGQVDPPCCVKSAHGPFVKALINPGSIGSSAGYSCAPAVRYAGLPREAVPGSLLPARWSNHQWLSMERVNRVIRSEEHTS